LAKPKENQVTEKQLAKSANLITKTNIEIVSSISGSHKKTH